MGAYEDLLAHYNRRIDELIPHKPEAARRRLAASVHEYMAKVRGLTPEK